MSILGVTSSTPMAGKVLPTKKPLVKPNTTPMAGKIFPTKKPLVKPSTTPMAGKIIKKSPKKAIAIVAGVAGLLAIGKVLIDKIKNKKAENTTINQ